MRRKAAKPGIISARGGPKTSPQMCRVRDPCPGTRRVPKAPAKNRAKNAGQGASGAGGVGGANTVRDAPKRRRMDGGRGPAAFDGHNPV